MVPAAVVLILVVIAALAMATVYNLLQQKRRRCLEAWGLVQAELRRRWDLIPGVVEAVGRHATGEAELLERVLDARGSAMAAQGVRACSQAERVLWTVTGEATSLAHRHPALKVDPEFARVREELIRISNRVALAEQQYNDVVGSYNAAVAVLWYRPVAAMFHLGPQVQSEIASSGSLSNHDAAR